MSTSSHSRRANRRDLLVPSFKRANLGCKLLGGAIDSSNLSIFQLDIHNSPRFGEYFRIWAGAPDNEAEVLDTDSNLRQLVLRVKESRRKFTRVVRKYGSSRREAVEEEARSSGGRILAEHRDAYVLELWTPEDEDRWYLCGRDDVRLFIAQVTHGTTVCEAHESLKPRAVKWAEGQWPGQIQRQGEWFFVPLAPHEDSALREHLDRTPQGIKSKRAVGPGRQPHIAEEVVRVGRAVYARGAVTHPDHRPTVLPAWRKVVRNREVNPTFADRSRLRWID